MRTGTHDSLNTMNEAESKTTQLGQFIYLLIS